MKKYMLTGVAICFGLTACATDPYTGESKVAKTAWGAGIGTALGAGVGALVGGEKGALIGAGIGAGLGAAGGGYMDLQAKELRTELAGKGVQIATMQDGSIHLIMPANITFDTDSFVFKPSFNSTIDAVAKILAKYDKTSINIVGHTDNTGTVQHNNELSLKRAQAVGNYLTLRNIAPNRVYVYGAGQSQPIAPNDTEAGRAQNRRVEITLKPI